MGRGGSGQRGVLAGASAQATSADVVRDLKALLDAQLSALATDESWHAALKVASRFHKYSFGNCLLIASQRPTASRVAGFKTWLALGRAVSKGEKGIKILAPRRLEKTEKDAAGNDKTHSFIYFRPAYVFDIEQTTGDDVPLPLALPGEGPLDDRAFKQLSEALEKQGVRVNSGIVAYGHCGYASNSSITLPIDPSGKTRALLHQYAHVVLKHTGREARQECEAESAAVIASNVIGLSTSNVSFRDLLTWSNGEASKLSAAGQAASKASLASLRLLGLADDSSA